MQVPDHTTRAETPNASWLSRWQQRLDDELMGVTTEPIPDANLALVGPDLFPDEGGS